MLTHAQVWSAIDRLAARAGLSASGLARRAGLDPTTFNKSKRITPEGRARWPSTESIAKALWGVHVKSVNGDIAFIKQGPAGKESGQSVPSVYLVKIDGGKVVKQ